MTQDVSYTEGMDSPDSRPFPIRPQYAEEWMDREPTTVDAEGNFISPSLEQFKQWAAEAEAKLGGSDAGA